MLLGRGAARSGCVLEKFIHLFQALVVLGDHGARQGLDVLAKELVEQHKLLLVFEGIRLERVHAPASASLPPRHVLVLHDAHEYSGKRHGDVQEGGALWRKIGLGERLHDVLDGACRPFSNLEKVAVRSNGLDVAQDGENENMDDAFCGTFGTRRANYSSSDAKALQSGLEGFIDADFTQLHHS